MKEPCGFIEALAALKNGKTVKRKNGSGKFCFIKIHENPKHNKDGSFDLEDVTSADWFTLEDVMSADWMVEEE